MAKNPDPADPRVRALLDALHPRAERAYELAESFADAVRPVFALDNSGRRFEQVGSCVLVAMQQEVFALSAAHVFELIGEYVVPIGCGNKVHYVHGDRFSSLPGRSGTHADDGIDAAVLHVHEPPDAFRIVALPADRLDLVPRPVTPEFCVALGYRVKRSRIVGTSSRSHQNILVSCDAFPDDYARLGVDPERFFVAGYGTDILVGDRWQPSPSPKGMSGGALVRIDGLPVDPFHPPQDRPIPRLTAITTERRRATKTTPQVLVGARIGFHLSLIRQFMPDALEGLGPIGN